MSGGSTGSVITGAIMVVLILVALYYLYKWLYNSTISTKNDVTQGIMYPFDPLYNTAYKEAPPAVKNYVVEGVADGGAYVANMWVYINDTKSFTNAGTSELANLLEIGNRGGNGNTLLLIALNPVNGGLIVRQNTSDTKNDQSPVNVPDIIKNYNTNQTYTANDRCDIINGIEYQRWIMITVVSNNRTLDVYIDGKLARSCVYKGMSSPNSSNKKVTITTGLNSSGNSGNNNRLKGFFSGVTFDTTPISPDAVWAMYQAGPTNITLWQQIKSFFNITATVNVPDQCSQCKGPGPSSSAL